MEKEATESLASLEALQTQTRDTTDNKTGMADAAGASAGSNSISQPPALGDANTKGDSSTATEPAITPDA